jgi:spore coat protein A
MKITRRQFLKGAVAAGVIAGVPGFLRPKMAHAFYQSPGIPLFNTALRGVGPGQIPVAAPGPFPAPVTGVTHYQMLISQFQDQIVPASTGLGPTTLWGYNPLRPLGGGFQPQKHLGGLLVANKGKPIQITFHNLLFVKKPLIPVDTTIPGANQAINRTAVHFHGGLVPWISDGGPFDWFDPYGRHGLSFLNNKVLNPFALPGAAEYYYPMNQSARFGWYHDHAFGITRTNAYAGIASGILIRDSFEGNLRSYGLPDYIENGGREIPLVIQDKIFVGPNIGTQDPTWSGLVQTAASRPGSLWYAHEYEPAATGGRWERGPSGLTLPNPSVVAEFFGDTMLVNGTVFPKVNVEARRYRLRFLNACNARFLNLQFYVADTSLNGITLDPTTGIPTNDPAKLDPTGVDSPNVLQIGTEGGFLAYPVKVPSNVPVAFDQSSLTPSASSLLVGPAERPDVIVDFSRHSGQSIILYNDADAPFPSGDARNDYFPAWNVVNNPVNATTKPGFGPNTRVLMRFNVGGGSETPLFIDETTPLGANSSSGIDPFLAIPGVSTPPPVNNTRVLTLNEDFDAYGRLIQLLGTDTPSVPGGGYGRAYLDDATEVVQAGFTEVWEIYNTTGDVHPMHFHLVNVQVINRQPFDTNASVPFGNFTDGPVPAPKDEWGWKETVKTYPGTVTRIIMKFTLAEIRRAKDNKLIPTPSSPRTGGNEFVWHCHILEHEEHDMMRPLVVT